MPIPVFGQIHAVTFLVPAAAGVMRFSKLGKAMRVLAVLCVLACINIAVQLLVALSGMKNYFVSDYYRLVEISLLCVVFYLSVVPKSARYVLEILGILFVVIWIVDMVYFFAPDRISSGMAMISRMFLIAMSIVALHASVKDERSRLTERPVFWVAIAVVLYASGTLFVLALSNELLKMGLSYFVIGWYINWSLLIITNLLYTKALLCKSQT